MSACPSAMVSTSSLDMLCGLQEQSFLHTRMWTWGQEGFLHVGQAMCLTYLKEALLEQGYLGRLRHHVQTTYVDNGPTVSESRLFSQRR
eukprot:1235279-Amphidinium_carterae.1